MNFFKQFSRLEEFRSSGFLTDVTFQVDNVTYRVHKLVLSCHSPVFEAMFRSNMSEVQSGVVVVEDVTPKEFAVFLHYLYNGNINENLTLQEATQLLVCADKYQTSSLLHHLDTVFSEKLTPNNAVELHQLADSFNRTALKADARCMMWLKFTKTAASESWKTVLPNDRRLMNELLLDFYARARNRLDELQGSVRITRHDNRHFRQVWKLGSGTGWYRPTGVRLSFQGTTLDFIVVFSRIDPFWVVSLYPNTTLPDVLIYCRASVSKDGETDDGNEYLFSWPLDEAHPTLGHRRVEVLRWDRSNPDLICVGFQLQAYAKSDRLPNVAPTIVEGWVLGQKSAPLIEPETPAKDAVSLFFGDSTKPMLVERTVLEKRCQSDVFSKGKDLIKMPHISEITGRTIVKYLNSGQFPCRDWIHLHLLEAAHELHLHDLILYVEQTLVWELDPSNVLDSAKSSHARHLNWLTGATAQYLKFHLDRVMRCDDEWRNLHFDYFEILMTEMHTKLYPCLLPNFLTAQRHN